jgi:hypothetical protein
LLPGANVLAVEVHQYSPGSADISFALELETGATPDPDRARFQRGDANEDGETSISDAVFVLLFLFGGRQAPTCEKAADSDDSGRTNVTDAVYLLYFLFLGDSAPRGPFGECGPDPTPDALTCKSFEPCEAP